MDPNPPFGVGQRKAITDDAKPDRVSPANSRMLRFRNDRRVTPIDSAGGGGFTRPGKGARTSVTARPGGEGRVTSRNATTVVATTASTVMAAPIT